MTKTEAKLIEAISQAKAQGKRQIVVAGAREVVAARKLADKGFGAYKSHSRSVVGESYFDHFHRRWETRRPYAVLECVLTFSA